MERTIGTIERRDIGERRTVLPSLTIGGYHISWGAIWAGVLAGIGTQVLLQSLGVGIGAATVNPVIEANPIQGLGTGAAIWLAVSTLIAYFISGMFAGRMSGSPTRTDGALHGLVTWAFSLVVTAFLVTSAIGGLFSGASNLFGKSLSAMNNTGGGTPTITDRVSGEVRQTVDQARAAVQDPQVQQNARQVGQKAAHGISMAGIISFIILLFAAALAAWGGALAVPKLARFRG